AGPPLHLVVESETLRKLLDRRRQREPSAHGPGLLPRSIKPADMIPAERCEGKVLLVSTPSYTCTQIPRFAQPQPAVRLRPGPHQKEVEPRMPVRWKRTALFGVGLLLLSLSP